MAEGDRKTIVLDDTGPPDDGEWWKKPDAEIGAAMVSQARVFELAMDPRRQQSRRYVQLHKGQIMPTSMYDAAEARTLSDDLNLTWNGVQASVNTAMSVVVRNRVRVTFTTTGADQEMQEAAKQAELFVAGAFAGNKVYEQLDQLWFMDAAVPGLGILMSDHQDGDIVIRRVIPDGLIYNVAESLDRLQQLFTVTWMSKWAAVAQFGDTPERAAAIRACTTTFDFQIPGQPDKVVPLVPIYRGWFLPSKKPVDGQDTDGRHVVAIPGNHPGCTLRARPWKWMRFPLSFLRVENATAGIWGVGIAERVSGLQYRLNELNMLIEEAARLGSTGKWMVDTGSNVNPNDLDNTQAGIVNFTTTAPQFVTIDGIPRDLLKERDTTYQQMFRELGLSEWTVAGVQPENIESGEGLRALREQEQGRAIPSGQNWDAAHVDLAELVVMMAVDSWEANEKGPTVKVVDPDGDGLVKVEFKNIAKFLQDPDAYLIQPYPTSILPSTPTGKFEKLREWRKDGTIDQATFVALSDMPDIHQESSLLLAGIKAVRHAVGQIVRLGPKGYEPPDPAMPLDLAIKVAHATYLKGLRSGMKDETLAALLSFIDDAKSLLEQQPAAAPAPTPVVAAPAVPSAAVPPAGTAPAEPMEAIEPAATGPVGTV